MHTAIYSLVAAALLQLGAAQPANLGHAHQHAHAQRDVVVTVTRTAYGNAEPTPAAAAAAAPKAPAPVNEKAKSSEKTGTKHGIVYSPYNGDHSCKSASQVKSDISKMGDYDTLRIYGVDCNQVPNVIAAAKPKKMSIFAGIFNIDSAAQDVQTLIKDVGSNWNMIHTVSVGNEVVNSGGPGKIPAVLAAIKTVRGALRSTPFTGSIVTVDTFNALIANPELCEASDYAAANAHAFFDPTGTAANAGKWAKNTAQDIKNACGGKKVVITESGWPKQGGCNGSSCPSPENQAAAIKSLKSEFKKDIILFTAFNDMWKSDSASTYGSEKYWGILDS